MLSTNHLFENRQIFTPILVKILSLKFLSNLGNAKKGKDIVIVNSLEDAIKEIKSDKNQDARAEAWEYMRTNILKSDNKDFWAKNFDKWKNLIEKSLFNSQARFLAKQMGLSRSLFFSEMPFMGIIGELLLSNNVNNNLFFTNQLSIFKNGNLVCGYNGRNNKYPENKYKVF